MHPTSESPRRPKRPRRCLLPIALVLAVTIGSIGCRPQEPQRINDPVEIEKERQEHLQRSQREFQEG